MTWEADIVNRAGNLSISGQFKIASESELNKFIDRLLELSTKANLSRQAVFYQAANDDLSHQSMPRANINASLSKRESQIYELMDKGLSRSQIADRVGISSDMVTYHLASLRKKIAKGVQ